MVAIDNFLKRTESLIINVHIVYNYTCMHVLMGM